MQATAKLEVGQHAPEFRLKGPGGQMVTLSEYRGRKNVVLVFFPLAFSGTCSHPLPAVEQFTTQFEQLGGTVLGISVDSHFSNTEFARKLRLSFPLLSDFKREASTAYGVFIPEMNHSARAVFVVDLQGRVAYVDVSADPGDPDKMPSNQRIFDVLKGLQ